jgi:hypothetical protein
MPSRKPAALSPTLELLRASRLEPLSVLIKANLQAAYSGGAQTSYGRNDAGT